MILPIHALVRSRMAEAVGRLYGLPSDDPVLTAIPVEPAPRRALGDMAVPLAFELARRLRKAPRAIAQEIVAGLPAIDGVARAEAAPNGYINVFLDRAALVRRALSTDGAERIDGTDGTAGMGAAQRDETGFAANSQSAIPREK